MIEDLKGKRALVTGSSTGIGAAVALELGRLGVTVAVHGNKNREAAETICNQIKSSGGSAVLIMGDVSEPEEAMRIVSQSADEMGGIDILINNAGGIVKRVTNADFDNEIFEKVYDLNVKSILNITKAAYPHIKRAGGGSIINTGSIAGRFGGFGGSTVYASAKAAVHSISRNAAREFAPDNIRVNTVAPGFIETPFHANTPDEARKGAMATIAMGRLGTAEECVGAYVFLCSENMSGYITGQIIDVNGGQLMP